MSLKHPYREPGIAAANEPPPEPRTLPSDDIALALILLAVGAAGILIGVTADAARELTFGFVLIALSAKVAWDARNASG